MKHRKDFPFVPDAVIDCIQGSARSTGKDGIVWGYTIKKGMRQQLHSLMLLSGAILTDDNWVRSTCIKDKNFEVGLISNRTVFICDLNRHFEGVYFHGIEDDFHTPTEGPSQNITASDGEASVQTEAWLDELAEVLS